MTYDIFEENMPRLEKKLNTIQKKCSKYGCEFHFEILGEVFKTLMDEETREKYTAKFIQVEASGIAKISDWEFVATIEHNKPYNIIRSFRTDIEIPELYYTADTYCDHCHTKRNRKDTYLIRNTVTKEFKQVGKSCLKEFTQGLSAEAVTQYISWFDELIHGEQPFGRGKNYYYVEQILRNAVEAVNLYGYAKTDCVGTSTKQVVVEQLTDTGDCRKRLSKDGFDEDREGNKEKATKILEWVSGLENSFGYISNLKASCSKEYCEYRDFGLICSAVAAYNREVEHQARVEKAHKQEQKSEWFGAEGQRVNLSDLSLKLLTSWDTQWGYTYLYKLTDTSGNIFTWKTSNWLGKNDYDLPETVSLKGTIKAHTEYNGIKQTELTRCKIA